MSSTVFEQVVFEVDLNTHKHLRYIVFPVDAGKDFCYRSSVERMVWRRNPGKKEVDLHRTRGNDVNFTWRTCHVPGIFY